MESDPLLPTYFSNSPRKKLSPTVLIPSSSTPPPSLSPLPENDEFTHPIPSSSSPLFGHLFFGSPTSLDLSEILINNPPLSSSHEDPNPAMPTRLGRTKTNLHRSRTAPAMSTINDVDHSDHPVKPSGGSWSIVRQAVVLLSLYLSLGVAIYSFNRTHFTGVETHPIVDALYFCIVTMCTIGYGDITPRTDFAKVFSIAFVLFGFGFIDILLSGMVNRVLDLQENLLLSTVKNRRRLDYIVDVKKGRMRIRMKVGLALGVVVLCIGVGTMLMHFVERLGWLDSFYLSVMSVTTVGYGDRAFKSLSGRLFASVWLLVSTLAVARAFLYLMEARIDKRHRMIAKLVLAKDMTVTEFLAADIDNNGFVSKSEYVIYKLKEMGKIADKDILPICQQFDRLDIGNCGKITLGDCHH
ncbi:Two-pore potassium channel 2 [Acorus calamus]|uniref:Two-pore potassium channel 2 n=1 Tax=Acorus calamus TaxID=4465 RepID=A0AAV9DEJ9_ACOCL|nr:Two-pore potassium channel 2 [Acorus calamus]